MGTPTIRKHVRKGLGWLVAALVLFSGGPGPAWGQSPIVHKKGEIAGAGGQIPCRVVSLVPSATETLFAIGAGDALVGVTLHDTWPPETADLPVVGGFFSPSMDRILALEPDLILLSDLHQQIKKAAAENGIAVNTVDARSMEDGWAGMRRLGRRLGKSREAEALVRKIQNQLARVAEKTARIPAKERIRVIRLMGRDRIMTPGDDSFQNDLIRAAGGIPPSLGKTGAVVPVSLKAWTGFNPQAIYGCGGDRNTATSFFEKPGWKDVAAVRTGRIYFFPCELTCRFSPNSGHFVEWLAARLYATHFAAPQSRVSADAILGQRPLSIDLPYVKEARVLTGRYDDFANKTLLLDLAGPMAVVSTLEGQRRGIVSVGNQYISMPGWIVGHDTHVKALQARACRLLERKTESTAMLFTGADMDHLSCQRQQFKEMVVYALVTAGVSSNAMRMGQDTGRYYEPGTINTLLLTNMRLSPRAMTRAIITATEAKSAALDDLDIRSSYSKFRHRATGTGTDNIIVVQGTGPSVNNAGGHSKMGELMARAVHQGVKEAIRRQNGITGHRHIFRRLAERGISLHRLGGGSGCTLKTGRMERVSALEAVLMDPVYAGYLSAAMAISDAREKGLMADCSAFEDWSKSVAGTIAGKPVAQLSDLCPKIGLPPVLRTALNAVLTGLCQRGH